MSSSLFAAIVAVCVRVFRLWRYRDFFKMVTAFNIVYNTVINFTARSNCRTLDLRKSGARRPQAKDLKPGR
jgi:hypothetical protein